MGRWVGGIATGFPGGHHAHADRSGQLAAPGMNIALAGKPWQRQLFFTISDN
jgi:hypothetical protein